MLLNDGKVDQDRITVIDWMTKKLQVIMYNFHNRLFQGMIPDCVKLGMVSKALIDKNLLFFTYQVLGCLYLHMDMVVEARKVFDLLRDVAEECHNWCHAMQAYEWIGRVLCASTQYEQSVKAYKKMMQLSWVNNVPEYEVKSYHNLSKQYFYLQYI